jgi:phosphopantothenoylcysteine decarboxylase/phosphopantothenate--cysteine ligase
MPTLVLGVSGSVAAYRAADLARELMRMGYSVRVCLTDSAQRFVTKDLFEALTGQPCLSDTFEEPESGRMAHIDWARQADLLVIAPATANTINRIAYGLADDMLTTLALAYEGLMIVAPAMNPSMYANADTQEAIKRLRGKGATIVEPAEGDVACGENGQGKLASIATIAAAVAEVGNLRRSLVGKTVLITSGPTQEPIDDVRFLSNHSSGKMGAALARAAHMLGARVVLVTGPTSEVVPPGIETVRVTTAQEMMKAASAATPNADLIIGAAAVADYRPAARMKGKIRRSEEKLTLELEPNPDIIAGLAGQAREGAWVVGFAAEPNTDLDYARAKMERKGLHAIAHNDVSNPAIGFGSDQNALTLIFRDGSVAESGIRSKLGCALWLYSNLMASTNEIR